MRSVDSALGFVHNSLKHHRSLSPEQEQELAYASLSGDLQARQSLVFSQLKLVASIAYQVAKRTRRSDLVEDLIQAGNRVLVEQVGKFDPGRGNRLSTFVYRPLVKAILRELGKSSREESTEEVPEQVQDSNRLKTLLSVLGQVLSPEQAEVLKYHVSLGMTFEEIVELKGDSVRTWKRRYASAIEQLKAYRTFLEKAGLL